MSSTFKRLGQSELLPRYIFAESLYARRRVLEIGAVASTAGQSAKFLSTRGARMVVAADADLQAVQEAQQRLAGPTLRFRPTVFDDFESGSFDLILVADLADYVRAPELLRELARLVARGGSILGGLRNPSGLALSSMVEADDVPDAPPTYGQLLDALSTHFESVEVATQSPVLGYQLAFERTEGLQVDGSLAGNSEAAYYVVIAGHEAVRHFDPTWVQLPPEPLAFTGGKLEDAATRARDWRDRTERLKEVLTKKTAELSVREADLRETTAQLEAAKEAVSRLTAQIELARERPEVLRDREELAGRIRQFEAELQVARERAIDAEGRVTATRLELEVAQRLQKDATITALASQEQARLERARREEVGTQLEDSRLRLVKAHEELRRVQDSAATERVEFERARLATDRLKGALDAKESELKEAADRELRLADARTESLKALEHLENGLALARAQLAEAREEIEKKEADRFSAVRSLDVEVASRTALKAELERETARAAQLTEELANKIAEAAGLETELEAARATHARAQRDIETLAGSERHLRDLTTQYEQRLADTTRDVEQMSDQVAQLENSLASELARSRRLEGDLTTTVTSERAAREQAEAALSQTHVRVKELSDDRDALLLRRDELAAVVGDLERVRATESAEFAESKQQVEALQHRLSQLEGALAEAQAELSGHVSSASSQERALKAALVDREATLEAQVERLTKLTLERDALLDSNRLLEAAANANAAELATLLAERDQLTGALADASSGFQATTLELARATAQATEREAALTRHASLLELERVDLQKKFAALQTEAGLVAGRVTDLEDLVRALNVQVRDAEKDARDEQDILENRVAFLTEQLERATGQLRDKSAAFEVSKREADERGKRVRELETQASATATALEQLTQREAAATQALNERQAEVAQLEAGRAALTEQVGELQRADARRAELLASLEAQLAEQSRVLEETRAELQKHHGEASAATQEAQSLSTALAQLDKEKRQLAESLGSAMNEAEHARAELQEALDARHAEQLDAAQFRASLEIELSTSQKTLTEVTDALTAARSRLETEAAAHESVRQALEATRSELAQAQAQVVEFQAKFAELQTANEALAMGFETERSSLVLAHEQALTNAAAEAARLLAERELDLKGQLTAAREGHQRELATQQQVAEAAAAAHLVALEAQRVAAEQAAQAHREALEGQRLEVDRAVAENTTRFEAKVAAGETRVAELERQKEGLEKDLTRSRELSEQQRSANRIQIELLQRQVADLKTGLERAQGEGAGHLSAKQTLQSEIAQVREELATLRTSLAQAGGETLAMAEVRTQLEGELARLRARVTAAEGVEASVPGLEAALVEARASLAAHQGDNEALRQQLIELELSVSDLKSRERDTGSTREALEAEVARLTAAVSAAEATAAAYQARALKLEDDVLEAQAGRVGNVDAAEVAELRRRVPELEAALEIERSSAKNDLEVAQASRLQAEELLLALRAKYGDLQHEFVQASEALTETRAENELLEQERERLASQLEEVPMFRSTISSLQARIDSLKTPPPPAPIVPPLETPPGRIPIVAGSEIEVFELDTETSEPEEILLLDDEATDPKMKKPPR